MCIVFIAAQTLRPACSRVRSAFKCLRESRRSEKYYKTHVPMLASRPQMPALSTQMGALVGCFHVGGTYSGRVFEPAGPMRERKEKEKKRGTYLWARCICPHRLC